MRRLHLEILAGLSAAVAFLIFLIQAMGYRGGSGMMPRMVLFLALALTAIWIIQNILRLRRNTELPVRFNQVAAWRFVTLFGGTAIAVLGISTLGYFTSAAVILPAIAVMIGYRRPLPIIIGTVAFVAVLFSVFHLLLNIPLPPEAILSIGG